MSKRHELPMWIFVMVVVSEFYTSNVIIFETVFASTSDYELFSAVCGPPRWVISIFVAYKLAGREFWKYYIILDNLTALGILSILCYYYFLLGAEISLLGMLGWLNFVVLVTLHSGHFRILLKQMIWTRFRWVIYKIVKIYYVSLYVGLAARNTVTSNLGELKDIYLLFVITTAAYFSEFIFAMSDRDGTHAGEWHYRIEEEEHPSHSHSHSHSQSTTELSVAVL